MTNSDFVKRGNSTIYFSMPIFEETGLVKHGFTTRMGGSSIGVFDSLNLGKKTDDIEESVYKNYISIFDELELDIDNIVVSAQTHSDNIYIVKEGDNIIGRISDSPLEGIDALITDVKDLALVTYYADCTPLFFLDKKKGVIALAHSGWKGTVQRIGAKVVGRLVELYGSCKEDILVGIGPCIGSCCYEVDTPVIDRFNDTIGAGEYYMHKYEDKYDLDLTEANKLVLLSAGIPIENISLANLCTHCYDEYFYSYRRDNGKTGRMVAIMSLK